MSYSCGHRKFHRVYYYLTSAINSVLLSLNAVKLLALNCWLSLGLCLAGEGGGGFHLVTEWMVPLICFYPCLFLYLLFTHPPPPCSLHMDNFCGDFGFGLVDFRF